MVRLSDEELQAIVEFKGYWVPAAVDVATMACELLELRAKETSVKSLEMEIVILQSKLLLATDGGLQERLAAAEKVVEAARATYAEDNGGMAAPSLYDALDAYDKVVKGASIDSNPTCASIDAT